MLDEAEIISKIKSVNDKWLETKPWESNASWENACYFMGCIEAYKETGEERYLAAALKWCEGNDWGTFGDERYATEVLVNHFTKDGGLGWRFENDADYLNIHADYITCGRVYLKMKEFVQDKADFSKVQKILDFTVKDFHNDYWWWVDAIHMGLCLYHLVSKTEGKACYAEKGHALYMDAKNRAGLYDTGEHLWYRDANYLPKRSLTKNGRKIFWSRGNGWVYAGLIQTMEVIGKDSKYYPEYEKTFLEMTDALMKCRGRDGFWRASLHDADEYPMIETSGTLLFLNGIIKAVRLGILDEGYLEIFDESFGALNARAVFEDGTLGWVQGVAGSPGATERNSTKGYAVGYYLMTCCEYVRYIRRRKEL